MRLRTAAVCGFALLAVAFFATGCADFGGSDEGDIRALLNSSGYTDDDNTKGYGAEDSTPTEGGETGFLPLGDFLERIPFVRFRRYIPPGGISRQIVIDIPAYPGYPDTTALATITTDINGEFRTLFDTTQNPMLVWRKEFEDEAVRTVYLTKGTDGWRIRKVSPLHFSTVDPAYDLDIAEFRVHAASWPESDTFVLTDPDTMLSKDQLPCFVPEDTVTVWLAVESSGDSCWAFLHHGKPKWPWRWRSPYFKSGTFEFERTWYVGPEGYDKPQVRPSAQDIIGWNTLWADSSEPYVSTAWGLPYIVKLPGEEIPEE